MSSDHRIIGYVRQSKARAGETEETSLSISQQIETITEWATRNGYARVSFVKDHDESGKTMERPGFASLRAAVQPGDVVVTYKYDRFARNLIGQELAVEELERLGVEVRSVTEPPGKLPRQLLGSIAEYYSDQLSERLTAVIKSAALAGRYLAARPAFGYRRRDAEETVDANGVIRVRRTGPIEVDPEAAPIVAELFARFVAGESIYAIGRDLNERGIFGPRGKPWHNLVIREILKNPAYRAVVRSNGQEVARGSWPPLIEDRVWFAARDRLEAKHRPRPKSDLNSWVSGRVTHACGAPMYLVPIKGHPRADGTMPEPEPTFVCRRSSGPIRCGVRHLSITARRLEAAVRACLIADLGDRVPLAVALARADADAGGADVAQAHDKLERQRAKATERLERGRELFLDDGDRARWDAEKERHATEIARIDAALAALPAAPDREAYRATAEALEGFAAALADAPDAALGKLLAAVGTVEVGADGIAIVYRREFRRFIRAPHRVGF